MVSTVTHPARPASPWSCPALWAESATATARWRNITASVMGSGMLASGWWGHHVDEKSRSPSGCLLQPATSDAMLDANRQVSPARRQCLARAAHDAVAQLQAGGGDMA